MNDDEALEFFQYLENEGILEWVGMDTSGERTFVFNFDIMRMKMPQLYEAMVQELDSELMHLYELGFIDIEYDENLNAGFKINQAGKEYLQNLGIPIPEEFDE